MKRQFHCCGLYFAASSVPKISSPRWAGKDIGGKGDRGGHKVFLESSVVILSPTSSPRLADKDVVGTGMVQEQRLLEMGKWRQYRCGGLYIVAAPQMVVLVPGEADFDHTG